MSDIQTAIVETVKDFTKEPDGPADEMLDALLAADRNDLTGKSAIRYMMRLGIWRPERNGGFHDAINHFFAHYDGRETMEPEEYQAKTKSLIQEAWGYECAEIVAPAPTKVETKPKVKKKPVTRKAETVPEDEEEGESGSRTFKTIREQEEEKNS